MLFEKLADKILKHSKLIICLWIVILVVSVPFVYKVLAEPQEILEYDMTTMVGPDSDSMKGLALINDPALFFQSDMGNDLILVVVCEDDTQKASAEGQFLTDLRAAIDAKYGSVATVGSLGYQTKEGITGGVVTHRTKV